jgi:hypothetical protein
MRAAKRLRFFNGLNLDNDVAGFMHARAGLVWGFPGTTSHRTKMPCRSFWQRHTAGEQRAKQNQSDYKSRRNRNEARLAQKEMHVDLAGGRTLSHCGGHLPSIKGNMDQSMAALLVSAGLLC